MTHSLHHRSAETPSLPESPIVLADHERQPCEVWTRVMGYFRPVQSFNIGKKGEYHERVTFKERALGTVSAAPLADTYEEFQKMNA